MLNRQPPHILIYGLGLALMLSLGFNGYLLLNQPYSLMPAPQATSQAMPERTAWQSQLVACSRSNQQKDSLIHALVHQAQMPAAHARLTQTER